MALYGCAFQARGVPGSRPYPLRRGYPCARIRCHTICFSSSVIKTQLETSIAVRPQPRHISSNRVEQTATQGESVATKAFCDDSASLEAAVSPLGVDRVLLIGCSLASAVRPFLQSPDAGSDKYKKGAGSKWEDQMLIIDRQENCS